MNTTSCLEEKGTDLLTLPVQELGPSNKSSKSQVLNNPKKCFFKLVTEGLQNTFPNDVLKAEFQHTHPQKRDPFRVVQYKWINDNHFRK